MRLSVTHRSMKLFLLLNFKARIEARSIERERGLETQRQRDTETQRQKERDFVIMLSQENSRIENIKVKR